MSTVMLWSKNIFHRDIALTSKAFYKWRYSHEKMAGSSVVADVNSEEKMSAQKGAYLLLFAENERLREQLNESRKNTYANEKAIRASAVKSMISIILRSRVTAKARYYFDLWNGNAKIVKLVTDNAERNLNLTAATY